MVDSAPGRLKTLDSGSGPGVAIERFRDKTNPRRLVKLPSVASGFLFPNRNCGLDFFVAPTVIAAQAQLKTLDSVSVRNSRYAFLFLYRTE